jgi:hypothetical protein
MQQAAVYDLLTCTPHVEGEALMPAAEFEVYRTGYTWALVMALRVMDAAERRYQLVRETKRLEASRRRQAAKDGAA